VWRTQVDCLFGLGTSAFAERLESLLAGAAGTAFNAAAKNPQVDRLPLEATVAGMPA